MKQLQTKILLLNTFFVKVFFIVSLISVSSLFAQWEPDIRLTNNPDASRTSQPNARCLATNGDSLHIVWYDFRDGNWEIYYKRSTNGGISGWPDERLTNNTAVSENPSVTVSGSVVHVTWDDLRDGNREIYYKRSTDAGSSWAAADTRLTNNSSFSGFSSVSVSGSMVHVVWDDERDGNSEIYYKRSTNAGISWGADTRLTNALGLSLTASVIVSGSMVHVTWEENRDGNWEIYYKRSTDAGANWEADVRLTNFAGNSGVPSISVSGSVVHILWQDERDGNWEIYYKRSTDAGVNWGTDTRLTNAPANSWLPSVSASGSNPGGGVHVTWQDLRDGNDEIYYKKSTDGGISWSIDIRLTNAIFDSRNATVSVSGSVVHVVWQDFRDGNWEIYAKLDRTGNPIGIINIGSEIPSEYSLGQNYPNPFNPVTNINLRIPKTGFVSLKVYDASGKESAVLVSQNLGAGVYNVDFDASHLASGVYFYRLETEGFMDVKKMMLVK